MKLRFACFGMLALWLGTSDRVAAQGPHGGASPDAAYRGGMVSPPLLKPHFTLPDTSGAPFDFWSKTQGYVTLLFFGFTSCPAECPLQMATVATAFKTMPADVAAQIKVVFVTTDPARDNPSVLRSWLDHFDRGFIGLTGTETAIRSAQTAAWIRPATKTVLGNGDYGMDHSAFVLAYTKDNLAHVIYPVGVRQSDWIHDLPYLVRGPWPTR